MQTKLQSLFIALALLAGVHQATAQAQNLFESDYYGGKIYEYATNGTQSTFAPGLSNPTGLAFNSAGILFALDAGSGNIYEFTTNGTQSTFASGLNSPQGLAFDSNSNLFVADAGSGNIFEFTNGIAAEKGIFASGLQFPFALAFNSAGNLFVADGGTIYEYTPLGAQSTFASGLSSPQGLAFDSAGDLFVADVGDNGPGNGNICEFTNNAGSLSPNYFTFVSGLYYPDGLAFDSAGNLFESDGNSGNIFKFTTNGIQSTFASGLNHPSGLAFSAIATNSTLSANPKMSAGIINLDFYWPSYPFYQTPFGPGAAAIGNSGDYWNGLNLQSYPEVVSGLTNNNGVATSVGINFSGSGGGGVSEGGGTYGNLFDAFANFQSSSQVDQITGLTPNAQYYLYVYSYSASTISVNGTSFSCSTPPRPENSLVLGTGYSENIVTADNSGNLNISAPSGNGDVSAMQLMPVPPALGISTYGNQPAVFFPTATGTNYVLQMTTNLASGNWVTVSNGIAISGLIITNPPAAAFFRLH